ncbi:unnamed protein product [Lampetra fluviatilis]
MVDEVESAFRNPGARDVATCTAPRSAESHGDGGLEAVRVKRLLLLRSKSPARFCMKRSAAQERGEGRGKWAPLIAGGGDLRRVDEAGKGRAGPHVVDERLRRGPCGHRPGSLAMEAAAAAAAAAFPLTKTQK